MQAVRLVEASGNFLLFRLRGFGFEATDQVIAKMRWCDFEKIDLVVLSHFNGAKADSLTWREFGEAIALRSALFVMKASFECARILDRATP